MTVVVATLVVVVLLLSVLVAGLLRSHAAILRQLHELGAGVHQDPGVPAGATQQPRTDGTVPAPQDLPEGRRAVDVVGVGPRGEALAVRTMGVDHDTLLVFLSTGCTTCSRFWSDLGAPEVPAGTRVVVVTRDPTEESPSAVLDSAPVAATVVMSSQAWEGLRVPGSPFVVHVHGPTGRVLGEGTAASWEQVLELFLRAGGDAALGSREVGPDVRRERELDRVLLDAGIAPGDPSLYAHDDEGRSPPASRTDDPAEAPTRGEGSP